MSSPGEETETEVQAQLAKYRAQVEHWQGVATICELSKQEELAELQKQCDQEIQSLQEALRETAEQYEARIAVLQSQIVERRKSSGQNLVSERKTRRDGDAASEGSPTSAGNHQSEDEDAASVGRRGDLEAVDGEGPPFTSDGKLHSQEDTDSLVSTGTLVPEAIYLPPAGHRLVTHSDWDALNTQVSELRGEVSRLEAVKEQLEKELDTQTNQTHKQVSALQDQIQNSEALLQDLQKSFSQSQNSVQSRLTQLSLSQRKMCCELSKLKGEEVEEEAADARSSFSALQGAHCEERLRIEIVHLREQLDTRTEENDVLQVQFSSLKTETERIQAQKDQLQAELLASRTELDGLRVALSHLQNTNKALTSDKASLHQQCLELRSQVISLRSQVDTSQTVQRDFVQLSQSLQVRLELIRQAESFEQVKEILEERVGEAGSSSADHA
ncbi:rab GTPase-binding effector protein 2 isoform X2 [Takifugu flavidus]|uniref:rab GTPase-binding effector protein 2 isoform X2 n=1 Tax=Takifugu flavidus TaxID=433684 RepID=UPI0025441807|nr:rab GTPase-binding effector protein 2 isoform X2 [Takifugu flavidus]